MNKIHAFIDSYEIITILVDKTIKNPQKKFYLSNGSYKEPIQIITSYEESLFYYGTLKQQYLDRLQKKKGE